MSTVKLLHHTLEESRWRYTKLHLEKTFFYSLQEQYAYNYYNDARKIDNYSIYVQLHRASHSCS